MVKKYLIFFIVLGIFDSIKSCCRQATPEYIHSSLARMVFWMPEAYAVEVINLENTDKAYLNAQDLCGDTALIVASRCGKVNVVRALLAKGAVMGLKNDRGQDAASAARDNRMRAIFELHVVED